MNFQKNFTKKILFILIISILSLNLTFLTLPKKVNAFMGVADLTIVEAPVLESLSVAQNAQTAGKTIWDQGFDIFWKFLKVVMRNLAKAMIINVTQATVSWINGGMNGQPAYKADLHKFITGPGGVQDQVMGQFFQDAGLGFLCSPFQLQVKWALQLGYGAGLKEKIGCTLTSIKQNINNGLANSSVSIGVDINGNTITGGVSDFRNQGGWNEWLNTTMQPQNNPIGAYLIAKEELTTQITIAGETKNLDFLSGSGAVNFTRCVDTYYDGSGHPIGSKSPEYTDSPGSRPRIPFTQEQIYQDEITAVQNCSVKTPGSVITGTLNKVTGSGIDQAGLTATLSDGIDALLAALANYYMGKLQKGVLSSDIAGYNAYNSAIDASSLNALNNYNADLSTLYDQQNTYNNTDWRNPDNTYPTYPIPTYTFSTSTWNSSTSSWSYDPITGDPYIFSTSTENYATSSWSYDPITGFPISNQTITTNNTNVGYSALDQAKNNANILINSLLKSESAYQNNYLIAQNILTQGKAVFATSSACNINYNRNDYVLRSLLIRANVTTNIDGTSNSDRTIASIPWNLEVIKAASADSNANITILNKATTDISGAGSLTAVTDAMIPINSTSFNTDPQAKMVGNIKTWLSGVGSIYNSLLCPIDLTKVLQITTATSTSNN